MDIKELCFLNKIYCEILVFSDCTVDFKKPYENLFNPLEIIVSSSAPLKTLFYARYRSSLGRNFRVYFLALAENQIRTWKNPFGGCWKNSLDVPGAFC
ncbi:hypothetical protein TNIN_224391 [Trichonephila inaurata madagascariensis]|uniref:Uncharacterized protein n=1 Tax=Trichonephila inaurata madagascariensis TaxID=2747483 RepID=A0A8X7CBT1_9ARAC|nr:hypothetical protein TNIN_224391 [Trichonephila inaurata madagascariensis]